MTEYWLFDPSGNITALIPLPDEAACDPSIAEAVMRAEPSCEQVGFVLPGAETCNAILQMAGGEFCGNASLCTGVLTAVRTGASVGSTIRLKIAVSGTSEPVSVILERKGEDFFSGNVVMPPVTEIRNVHFPDHEAAPVPVVIMPGISHAIVPESFGMEQAEAVIRDWCSVLDAPALGIMLTDATFTRLTPLVYVPAVQTLYRENSCASGTAALGALLAYRRQSLCAFSLVEPGGTLSVSATPDGSVTLGNTIRVLRRSCI